MILFIAVINQSKVMFSLFTLRDKVQEIRFFEMSGSLDPNFFEFTITCIYFLRHNSLTQIFKYTYI